MPPTGGPEPDYHSSPRVFSTTQWTVVLAAKQGNPTEVDAALEKLCQLYRRPVYYFILCDGHRPHDAEDLTQDFFRGLTAPGFFRTVDRSKGKFRSFLLRTLKNFLFNKTRDAKAQKRGGNYSFVSIDAESSEPYLQIQSPHLSPEQLFDQQWAIALFSEVLNQLRKEYMIKGKEAQFEAIQLFLTGEKRVASYHELAAKLATTQNALKMAVNRMRKRYGKLLRAEIAKTVRNPGEVEEELLALRRAFSPPT